MLAKTIGEGWAAWRGRRTPQPTRAARWPWAGSEAGRFLELRDITLDARGSLYSLDGVRLNPQTKAPEGNRRVQKFDAEGKLLGPFSPTYVWSANGPRPAALALRTRHALTSALNRKYLGTLDFGPNGNTFLKGTRYGKAGGETLVLRNMGTRGTPA